MGSQARRGKTKSEKRKAKIGPGLGADFLGQIVGVVAALGAGHSGADFEPVPEAQAAKAGPTQGAADLLIAPGNVINGFPLMPPELPHRNEPIESEDPGAAPAVVAAAQEQLELVLLHPFGHVELLAERSGRVEVKEEPAAGAQGASHGAEDGEEIGSAGEVVQGGELAGDEVNRAGEAEAAHVGAENAHGEARAAGLVAADAAESRREVDGVDLEAVAGKVECGFAGAASEIASGANPAQRFSENSLSGVAVHRRRESSERVVEPRQQSVGPRRWDSHCGCTGVKCERKKGK